MLLKMAPQQLSECCYRLWILSLGVLVMDVVSARDPTVGANLVNFKNMSSRLKYVEALNL